MKITQKLKPQGPATAIVLTDVQVDELGGGKRAPVAVTFGLAFALRDRRAAASDARGCGSSAQRLAAAHGTGPEVSTALLVLELHALANAR